ncbi:MAG: hypothetical protein JNM94_09865 [Phycisphaerae bacterium]|nr:hypothetical protein [Phycisphaerae bacterium]
MTDLTALWLPILVSAVVLFVLSSVIWMALPIHKKDYQGLKNEAAVMEVMKRESLEPGIYCYPWCPGNPNDEASKEKMRLGPWGQILVAGGPPTFGRTLGLWFVHLLVVGTVVGYITGLAVPRGAEFLRVFQVAGTAALLAYGGSLVPKYIWEGKPWRTFAGSVFDCAVYTLATGAVFAFLWPKAF